MTALDDAAELGAQRGHGHADRARSDVKSRKTWGRSHRSAASSPAPRASRRSALMRVEAALAGHGTGVPGFFAWVAVTTRGYATLISPGA